MKEIEEIGREMKMAIVYGWNAEEREMYLALNQMVGKHEIEKKKKTQS